MRIIEVALSSEYELDDIIRNGMISEDETTMFYNFRRKDGITRTCGMQLNKFVLLESMKGLYKRISCNEYTHRYSSAIFEITFDYYTNRTIDPLTFGWVIAYKNYENVRNCFLCKYYKTNYYTSERICCLYKKKGIERHCKSSEALRCNEFSIDKNIINENCDYLSYITYNIWKKGMGNEGIRLYKRKGSPISSLYFCLQISVTIHTLCMTCRGFFVCVPFLL